MDVNFQRILTRFEVICSQDQTMDEHRRRFLDFIYFFAEIVKCWTYGVRFFLFQNVFHP